MRSLARTFAARERRHAHLLRSRVAVVGGLAGGQECLPGDSGRIVDPGLLGLRVAAGGLAFLEYRRTGLVQPRVDLTQLALVLHLDAEMVQAGLGPAHGDRE